MLTISSDRCSLNELISHDRLIDVLVMIDAKVCLVAQLKGQ